MIYLILTGCNVRRHRKGNWWSSSQSRWRGTNWS